MPPGVKGFQKGHKTNIGKHWVVGEEGRKNNSESKKGKPAPWMVGRIVSDEIKQKLSNYGKTRIGELNPFYGKKVSEEHRKKLIDSHKGKKQSKETIQKRIDKIKGIKLSEEHKRKISESRKGEKHWRWMGGITPLKQQIRKCFEYRQWKSDIFTRDCFSCVLCGKHGGYLEVDHFPKSFSEIFHENKIKDIDQAIECEEFWNINNGRTLCLSCHNKTHKLSKVIY